MASASAVVYITAFGQSDAQLVRMFAEPVLQVVSFASESFASVNAFIGDRLGRRPNTLDCIDVFARRRDSPRRIHSPPSFRQIGSAVEKKLRPVVRLFRVHSIQETARCQTCTNAALLLYMFQRLQETKLQQTDWSDRERIVNVVTSLPYAVVGASMLRYASSVILQSWLRSLLTEDLHSLTYHRKDLNYANVFAIATGLALG